jgi:hypothetical protein
MSPRAFALALLVTACGPPPEPVQSPPEPPDAAAPSAVLANEHALVQGRLALGASGKASEAWIDIEVDGPGADALPVCTTLIQQERARLGRADPHVAAEVERPCSDRALAPPRVSAPFALLQSEKLDAIELALELGPAAEGRKLEALRVRRTVLSGFTDAALCEAALGRITEQRSQNAAQAGQAARGFLSAELDKQKSLEKEACERAPASPECKRDHEITTLLEEKLGDTQVEHPGVSDPRESTASCYRR